MTQNTQPQTQNSLHTLRDALEQAERQVVRLDRENINAFLIGLDRIDQMFAEHGQDTGSMRAEETRWESLRKRIAANPQLVVTAAASAGGLVKLRSQHAVAGGPWWHLDTEVARRRNQMLQRAGLAMGAVVVVALIWWGVTTFFPSADTLTDTTNAIEQLVTAQKWPEALAVVAQARQTQPDEAELLVWEAIQTPNSAS